MTEEQIKFIIKQGSKYAACCEKVFKILKEKEKKK